ncbi:MAG TPA: hypothetical protein VMU17_02035 [Elusimicrobiota bacterium]|nr:hypothetical protein [Elusimicrobiota bacterium]
MEIATERRHFLIGIALWAFMMVFQARPIVNLFCPMLNALVRTVAVPHNALPVRRVIAQPAPVILRHHRHFSALKSRVASPPAEIAAPAPKEINGLKLQTYERAYRLVFSGIVTRGGSPCAASVDVSASTTQNPEHRRHVQTAADGSYMVLFPINEMIHEQVDWKVVITPSGADAQELHGRQILMEDPDVSVDGSLSL